MVEGGRIDHAHHDGNAYRSLEDMVAFDNAIKAALGQGEARRDPGDRDRRPQPHAARSVGYPKRGNPILDTVVDVDGKTKLGKDGKPITTLGYANGPGAVKEGEPRPVPAGTTAPDYKQQSLVPARQRDARRRGRGDLRGRPVGAPFRRRGGAELHLPRHRARDEARRTLRTSRGGAVGARRGRSRGDCPPILVRCCAALTARRRGTRRLAARGRLRCALDPPSRRALRALLRMRGGGWGAGPSTVIPGRAQREPGTHNR